MIIGTAGHVDHGKTALVKALTGVDGDRLKEEKARGITIDLGFAYLPIKDGPVLGFIDVPGHERFVHTMLAGASSIDFALMVVAADDGIMPQTVEHLAIIDLLGIARGLVALTKTDLVSAERLAEVTAAIGEAVAGTALQGADILPVSAKTGHGIDSLRRALVTASENAADRSAHARFRLAVDRVFTLPGVGVVVTGTVLSGAVHVGDQVQISPSGLVARVRSLHAQSVPAQTGRAGDRCAMNLTGEAISKDSIHRGDVVLDPELHAPTDRIDAQLVLLPSETKQVRQWFPVRLHHCSAEVGARVVLLDDEPIWPGTSAVVQLALDHPIAGAVSDRYVIRDTSAQRTIGGGRFIDLRPSARRRRTPERQAQRAALAIPDAATAFEALLATPPFAFDLKTFARDRALPAVEAERIAKTLELVLLEQGHSRIAIAPIRWQMLVSALIETLKAYHMENPDLQGIGREQMRLLLPTRIPAMEFAIALRKIASTGEIVLDGSFVRLTEHTAQLASKDETIWSLIAPLLGGDARFRPPRVRDLAAETSHHERDIRRILKLAGRLGWADEIAHDHFFLRSTTHAMVVIVADIAGRADDGTFTAAQFRDRVANGRKVAIQILEFFDRQGITQHRDDLRRINRHRLDLFGTTEHASDQDHGRESSLVGRSDFKSE